MLISPLSHFRITCNPGEVGSGTSTVTSTVLH
jgi:hypothetical protein